MWLTEGEGFLFFFFFLPVLRLYATHWVMTAGVGVATIKEGKRDQIREEKEKRTS